MPKLYARRYEHIALSMSFLFARYSRRCLSDIQDTDPVNGLMPCTQLSFCCRAESLRIFSHPLEDESSFPLLVGVDTVCVVDFAVVCFDFESTDLLDEFASVFRSFVTL
jgi:hypothetical protein